MRRIILQTLLESFEGIRPLFRKLLLGLAKDSFEQAQIYLSEEECFCQASEGGSAEPGERLPGQPQAATVPARESRRSQRGIRTVICGDYLRGNEAAAWSRGLDEPSAGPPSGG